MTVQSSFLVRCWLTHSPENGLAVKSYHVQHVQSSAEFRSTSWTEVTRWIDSENTHFGQAELDRQHPAPGAAGSTPEAGQ